MTLFIYVIAVDQLKSLVFCLVCVCVYLLFFQYYVGNDVDEYPSVNLKMNLICYQPQYFIIKNCKVVKRIT